jgi:uncharacterized protein (TIGR02271 family)
MPSDLSSDSSAGDSADPRYHEPSLSAPELIDAQRLQLHAEDLEAVKSTVQAKRALVTRRAVVEKRLIEVDVWHEELVIDYVDGDGSSVDDEGSPAVKGGPETIIVQLREEEIEIVKHLRVAEEVHITKRTVTEEQQIRGEIRREVVHIDEISP